MNNYIDFDSVFESVLNIYKSERDSYMKDESQEVKDFLVDEFSDDYLEELSYYFAEQTNRDMKKYLHGEHKIYGNFNNIDYDYNYHKSLITGIGEPEIRYDFDAVNAMIKRLDGNEQSDEADLDRKILTDWFWLTFGTWGIAYNFQSEMSERVYEYENELETAC